MFSFFMPESCHWVTFPVLSSEECFFFFSSSLFEELEPVFAESESFRFST
jgi:hypothetical protein